MTQEEIKSRNMALAAYMGWEVAASLSDGQPFACNREDSRYMHWDSNPPFHTDMNLLMPVVWKLVMDGWKVEFEGFLISIYTDPIGDNPWAGMPVFDSYETSLWAGVSNIVMELQQKAV